MGHTRWAPGRDAVVCATAAEDAGRVTGRDEPGWEADVTGAARPVCAADRVAADWLTDEADGSPPSGAPEEPGGPDRW
ncbi:hypothetical protein [Streptomyces sp. NPDC019937]|uniref:hypothetical protein n=1 Tax=Streptomyces sp. NPDC019937 TaxID=3154787 RepID=UPI0033F97687